MHYALLEVCTVTKILVIIIIIVSQTCHFYGGYHCSILENKILLEVCNAGFNDINIYKG